MPYVFGDYLLHTQRRELSHRGRAVSLRPQVFDLLVYLVTHHDRVVSKQELHANLWLNVHVSPATLSAAIKRARQAVGDSGAGQHMIQTLHGRGYRFVAPVEEREAPSPTARPATEPTPAPNGAALAEPGEAGELKPVSVLCGALADGPALAATLGPEGLYRMLHTVRQATRSVMQEYAGTLISQAVGEGFTAVFGAPLAQEDHSRRAVLAALDLRERLRQAPGEPAPILSMGIHSSVAVVGDPGLDPSELMMVVGPASQGAMQLQQQAAPGALLVSAPAYHAVQDDVGGEVCGSLAVDGREPMAVYAVQAPVRRHTGVRERSRRPRSPFVGRQRELALLHDRLTVVRSGEGQVVSLLGAPGIGKTRLLIEFGRSVTPDAVTWYGVQCLPYGHVAPYWTAREFLRHACAVVESDPAAARAEAVRRRLTALDGVTDTDVALMLQVLDLPSPPDLLAQLGPEVRHARTFALLWQIIRHEAERRPLVLAVDNVHWIDATSAAWLAFLVERLADTAVLLLLTARPGTPAPWGTHAAVTQLVLPPLRAAESEALVQAASEGASLSAALNEQVVARGAGNPFFLEELARHAVEHGGAATPVRVPETVHAVLAARIDRLAPAAKHLLQAAAVLGMQVTEPLLRAAVTTSADVELHTSLQELQAAEFLYERRAAPVRTYTFKHALTQEVAYQSLLTHTRQQHHQRIARVVAEQFPDLAAAQPELVAQHYTAAGLPAEALPYWQRAGQLALQRSANREAVAHLTTALEVLAAHPDSPARAEQELDLQLTLGPVLMAIKGQAAPEVERTYARAWALCQIVGDRHRRFQALWGLQRWYRGQGVFSKARELGEELVRLAEGETDPGRRLEAHDALGTTLFFLGDYTAARKHLERGSAFTDPVVQRDFMLRRGEAPGVRALAFMAWTLWCLGYPAKAAGRSKDALALAQELDHPYSVAGAQLWAADLHLRRREAAEAQALSEALVTLATAQGYPVFLAMAMCYRGSALAMQGESSAGLALLREGMTACAGTGHAQSRPRCLMLLADAAGRAGQVEEALRLLGEAREALEANGQGDLLAEVHRLQGALLLHDAVRDEVQAGACFQRALAIARSQRARSWELRAAVALARLWQQQGKHREARDLLDPIYGWFTEGLDTADLREARALLPARVSRRRPL